MKKKILMMAMKIIQSNNQLHLSSFLSCWTIFWLTHLVSLVIFGCPASAETSQSSTVSMPLIVTTLIYSCAIVPIVEELLFRALAFRIFRYVSLQGQIIFSALLFAIVHHKPQQILPTFCLGLLLGMEYGQGRKLKNCILLHATTNIVDGLFLSLFPVPVTICLCIGSAISILYTITKTRRLSHE